jgi:hypothetical protein
MHQKQPPPNVADSVLFVFMELVGCASADKFSAPAASKKQIVCFIFPFAKFIPFRANPNVRPAEAGVFLTMLRMQQLENHMSAAEPSAKVNQPATTRTKRPVRPGKPVAGFFADRTFDPANALIWFQWQWF